MLQLALVKDMPTLPNVEENTKQIQSCLSGHSNVINKKMKLLQ